MPTYDYRCSVCNRETSVFQTISEYIHAPKRPICIHGAEQCVMDRRLSVNPIMSGLANALAGDRHYDGLKATDGSDISTRTKHREYMKANNLAMASDFKETWAEAARERERNLLQNAPDQGRKKIIAEQVMEAVARPGD